MTGFAGFGFQQLDRLVGNVSNTYGTGDTLSEHQRKDAINDYETMERTGIVNRVEGAKAAGLHPLAALGFQAGSGPSIPVGGQSGPRVDPQRPQSAPVVDQDLRNAQVRLLNAQASELETRATSSWHAMATQPGNPPVYPTEPENMQPGQGSRSSGIKVVPNEIVSSINGREVGMQPTQAHGRGGDGYTWQGLSDWGLKQTEDMEMTRLGLLAFLNRHNILDKIGWSQSRFDKLMEAQRKEEYDKRNPHKPWDAKRNNRRDIDRELYLLLQRGRN